MNTIHICIYNHFLNSFRDKTNLNIVTDYDHTSYAILYSVYHYNLILSPLSQFLFHENKFNKSSCISTRHTWKKSVVIEKAWSITSLVFNNLKQLEFGVLPWTCSIFTKCSISFTEFEFNLNSSVNEVVLIWLLKMASDCLRFFFLLPVVQ